MTDPRQETLTTRPGPQPGTVQTEDGRVLTPPATWKLLEPGDAALTRRVKQAGPHWVVQEKRGRKMFSRGIWADARVIAQERAKREAEQDDPAYQRRLEAGRARRQREQEAYVASFEAELVDFLAFPPRYGELASQLARAVTEHATPVGSGTVARTKRLELRRKVEAAVIAWMRHQTTAYDHIYIPRVKGYRREVRRKYAEQSRRLLNSYRKNEDVDPAACPLQQALREA